MQAKQKRSFVRIISIAYTKKKKVNTCKNESSGDKRKNEHAGNQFKKALDLRQC
jgi:hypothetical protein